MPTATNVGHVFRRLNDDGTHAPVSRDEVSESADDIYEVTICGISYAVRATVSRTRAPQAGHALISQSTTHEPPVHTHSQIIMKKNPGRRGHYTINSCTFMGPIFITTSSSHSKFTNFQERRDIKQQEVFDEWDNVDASDFPDPALMNTDNLKDMIIARMNAGEIGAEYIGKHQVPALAYPPLEMHDANHSHLIGELVVRSNPRPRCLNHVHCLHCLHCLHRLHRLSCATDQLSPNLLPPLPAHRSDRRVQGEGAHVEGSLHHRADGDLAAAHRAV